MANFQSILDCFIPNFKLKHEVLENRKADCASTVVFNLHKIKRQAFFMGHPVYSTFESIYVKLQFQMFAKSESSITFKSDVKLLLQFYFRHRILVNNLM